MREIQKWKSGKRMKTKKEKKGKKKNYWNRWKEKWEWIKKIKKRMSGTGSDDMKMTMKKKTMIYLYRLWEIIWRAKRKYSKAWKELRKKKLSDINNLKKKKSKTLVRVRVRESEAVFLFDSQYAKLNDRRKQKNDKQFTIHCDFIKWDVGVSSLIALQ